MPDPFQWLAGSAAKLAADAWTTAMLGLWNAGLWVLRLALGIVDHLLTPDLSPAGPGAAVYATTLWLAGALVLVMLMVQLGVTALRRDGKSLATALVGLAKFVVVWAGWLVYGAAVVAAGGGISRALMRSLLQVDSWAAWQPFTELKVDDVTDATVATVLGLLGLLLWLAAIGHLLVMVTRAGALVVLAAMTPVMAAGLVADAGRPWFWKSLRWFHAAAFTPVLMVLILGVGVQMTSGVAYGRTDTLGQAVGTAVPGVLLILIACFAPLALFKLLAFVDPTTNSGAALRTGLSATDGVGGFLTGRAGTSGSGSGSGGAAPSGSAEGRSSGEAAAADATDGRFSQAQTSLLRSAGGGVGGGLGAAAAAGIRAMAQVATTATAVGSDLTDQMGAGHPSYHPFIAGAARTASADSLTREGVDEAGDRPTEPGTPPDQIPGGQTRGNTAAASTPQHDHDDLTGINGINGGSGGSGGSAATPRRGRPPVSSTAPTAAAGGGGQAAGGAAEGEAAGAAASVPIIPV